jgi:hypothetical protein
MSLAIKNNIKQCKVALHILIENLSQINAAKPVDIVESFPNPLPDSDVVDQVKFVYEQINDCLERTNSVRSSLLLLDIYNFPNELSNKISKAAASYEPPTTRTDGSSATLIVPPNVKDDDEEEDQEDDEV